MNRISRPTTPATNLACLILACALFLPAHSSRAEGEPTDPPQKALEDKHGGYQLTPMPPEWQKILEARRSFDGTASLRDFIQFIFRKSNANIVFTSNSKTEFYITASFRDRTLEEILRAISKDLPILVSWSYQGESSQTHSIGIHTTGVDLMSKKVELAGYPARITLLPGFGPVKTDP